MIYGYGRFLTVTAYIFDFIESYLPSGFLKIRDSDRNHAQTGRVDGKDDQFLFVMQMEQIKSVFTSKRRYAIHGYSLRSTQSRRILMLLSTPMIWIF